MQGSQICISMRCPEIYKRMILKLMKDHLTEMLKSCLRCLSPNLLEEPFRLLASAQKAFLPFKNLHTGERCFIIGNGPSLNDMDLTLLNDQFTFAVNGIFYKTDECGFRPFYYVVEDSHVIRDNAARIREYEIREHGAKFLPSRFRFKLLNSRCRNIFMNLNRGFYDETSGYFETPRFSVDASRNLYSGQSVTIVNLQLAYYMGFKEVYLIGMDFSYKIPETARIDGDVIESMDDDVNHFHPDYFGKGKKWHDPKLHNVLKSYKLCKLMYELDDRKIINATVGGRLEVFPRANFIELFK